MSDRPQYQHLDKFSVPAGFRERPGFIVQLWWIVQDTLFRWSPQFMFGWRRFLLRLFGAKIGQGVLIRPSARLTYPWKVTIGDYAWIGDQVELYSLGEIQIGAHAVISQKSYLSTGTHNYSRLTYDIEAYPIKIGDQVWVATDVFIAPGVEIGRGTLVGARSSVFESLPPGKICYGTPARPVKDRPAAN